MTVLGVDNRSQVGGTTANPYSAVVLVRVDFDGDGAYESWGSGAMISANDVLTAAHVLWDPAYGYAKNVQVVPAMSGGSTPFGTAQATALHVTDGYVAAGGDLNVDFGVVNLGSSIGAATGTFALQPSRDSAVLIGDTVVTAGYPGDWSSDGSVMVTASGEIHGRFGGTRAVYSDTLDTYGGQSGSPLWQIVNGQPTVVGIHTAGFATYNNGTVVTTDFYNVIAAWTGGDTRTSMTSPTTTHGDSVAGTDTVDLITGNAYGNRLFGYGADDAVLGGAGNDLIYGNLGTDLLSGGDGADTIFGGQNSGPVGTDGFMRSGNETVIGGSGDDVLYGNVGTDYLYGENGNDRLFGGQDADVLLGGGGDDRLAGNRGNDFLSGGDGYDTLSGGAGDDVVVGGLGRDKLDGGDGSDRLSGGSSDDTISGGAGDDLLSGGDGLDTLMGGAGNDTVIGGYYHDRVSGGAGDDLLYGDGTDVSTGGSWDLIDGGEGEDTAVYLLDSSRYTVTRSDSGVYYLNSWESLRNVEYLRFADTIVAIDSLI